MEPDNVLVFHSLKQYHLIVYHPLVSFHVLLENDLDSISVSIAFSLSYDAIGTCPQRSTETVLTP